MKYYLELDEREYNVLRDALDGTLPSKHANAGSDHIILESLRIRLEKLLPFIKQSQSGSKNGRHKGEV